ncbi:superoxide dismutase [Paraurantiacibacter namhicola]|uniref:Superoxide dismutase n=1 Tax=Paraurantiacibacter namhicola TaxID=645517 RepID=A0A1C7DBG4_9SPHN|nr:superoxide dismutase [Paraurantiacibacter namhicola]ANU08784.1 Superoxide dismutase (Fe) [Paraurantiacibacter namhicola]
MAFEVTPLPYASDALAPAVSAETLSFHHGKHHQAYVDKTNKAIEGTAHADKALEEIISAARGSDQGLFNNSAQSWNHGFYWHSLSADAKSPSGDLADKIDSDFGGFDELKAQLKDRGAGHFASGWVWLAEKDGKLSIEETHDGDTLADKGFNPLLTIDLWEHAYYLDHQNKRPEYLEQVVENHLNWDFAGENLARGSAWSYS